MRFKFIYIQPERFMFLYSMKMLLNNSEFFVFLQPNLKYYYD